MRKPTLRTSLLVGTAVFLALTAACGTTDEVVAAGGIDTAEQEVSEPHNEDHDSDDHDSDEHDDHDSDDSDDHDGDGDGDDHDSDDHDDHDDHDSDDSDDHDGDDHDSDDHDDHDDETGSLAAHVHGEAELFVASSGGDVVIDLVSPAINLFGFEREPETDEERSLVDDANAALAAPGVISLNESASCTLAEDVESEFVVEGSHAEVTTAWIFTCKNPDEIAEVDLTQLFNEFPGLEDIDAQWTAEAGQSAAELSPASTVLQLG